MFASQYDQIARHRGFNANQLNSRVLKLYLSQHYIPAPYGILDNTFQVEPGQIVSFDKRGGKKSRRYWEFPKSFDSKFFNYDSGIKHIDRVLTKSVSAELVSDVPLCSFLSGGIDSALISYYANQEMNEPLSSITIGSNSIKHDETSSARKYGKLIGVKHTIKKMTANDARNLLDDVGKSMREPFADFSILPTFLVSKIAKEQATVALSGDGADEILAGYDPFLAIKPSQFYNKIIPKSVHYLILKMANILPVSNNNLSFDFKVKKTLSGLSYPQKFISPIWMSILDPNEINELFNIKISLEELYSETLELFELHQSNSTFDNMLYFFTKFYLSDNILTKLDTASMANSLETRTVFLDNDIINFVETLPHNFKIKNGNRKYILKKAVENLIPKKIINRKKKGFGTPISSWFLNEDINIKNKNNIYNHNKINRLIEEHKKKIKDNSRSLFGLLSLEKLLK